MNTSLGEGEVDRVRGEDSVIGDYTLVTAAGLGSAGLSFLSATLTTRVLAPQAFGALSLVLITSLILQTATSSWTSLAVTRFGREAIDHGGTMAAVTRARLSIVAPWFLVAALLIVALKAADVLPRELSWPLVGVAVLHGTIAVLYEHCTNLLRSWGRQRLSALTVILQQAALVVVIGVLLIAGDHARALEIGLLYVAGSALLLAVYVPILRSVGFARTDRDRDLERRMWRFSAPLIAFSLSAYLIGSVDLWVLSAFAPSTTVGTYAAAYRAYTVLLTVAASASPVLMTLFVSLRLAGRTSEAQRFVAQIAPALVLAAGSLVALLVAPAYALVPIVFGRAFGGGSLPLAILLIGVVAYLQSCLLGSVLTAHDRTADTARIIAVAAAANLVADLVVVGGLGAGSWAAAVATVASGLIIAAGYVWIAADCTAVRLRLTVAPYVAPSVAVVALVIAPGSWRVPASLGSALIAITLTFILRSRAYAINREFVGHLRGLWHHQ